MIWESSPWKNRLLSDADLLERWAAKKSITERRSFLLEQKIFISAYSIRKLMEAEKVSSYFSDRSERCQRFNALSDHITKLNNHKLDELYDMSEPVSVTIPTKRLIDMIIHSFVFAEAVHGDMTIEGFYVTSDQTRYDALWLINLERFIQLMREVGKDYPSIGLRILDIDKNDWFVWQGNGEPPPHVKRKIEKIRAKLLKRWKPRG